MAYVTIRRPVMESLLDDNPWQNYVNRLRLLDHLYGGSIEDQMLAELAPLLPLELLHARAPTNAAHQASAEHSNRNVVASDESNFKVNVDIRQFRPEEVNVKLVDNRIVIHAKHEEREDQHGFIKREFTRTYVLPSDVDYAKVIAKVGNDGTLQITAPRHREEKAKEIVIPIQRETRSTLNAASANSSANVNANSDKQK